MTIYVPVTHSARSSVVGGLLRNAIRNLLVVPLPEFSYILLDVYVLNSVLTENVLNTCIEISAFF